MAFDTNQNFLVDVVRKAIDSEIEKLVKEAVEEAKKELDFRVPEIIASISVNIMKMTEFRVFEDRIVFTILKKEN